MKKGFTQKKGAFYLLWQEHKKDPEKYMPAWQFVGEFRCKELGEWFFLSYKGPTNGLAIYFDNPGLVERRRTTGKTGAKYFEYRLALRPRFEMIKDEEILKFARAVERLYEPPRA